MKKKIELIDLKQRYKNEKKDLIKIFDETLSSGNLVLTKELDEFENLICKFTGAKFCLGLNSGTDALMMSLLACGIKKGDEVITSAISFIATAGAIHHVGAIPVFVDVKDDLNIDPSKIEKKITEKTKAIIPVHWTGRMCDMAEINKIAKKHSILVIEDAAQAMGSFYKKKHAGSFSKIAAFSAHPLKNLNGIGDGGFITTNDKAIYTFIKKYRNHGLVGRDNAEIFGINSRLDIINAKILTYRLKKLKQINQARANNIKLYKKYLKYKKIIIIDDHKDKVSSNVMFVTLCEKRDKLKKFLEKKNIQTLIYYGKPLHRHKASKHLVREDLHKAEQLCKKVLAFPHHQYLKKIDIQYICKQINLFYERF
jgi:dTDP-4-amino-4,6-dideoxygalactose transaminase